MGILQSTEVENPDFKMKEIFVVERECECAAVVERLRRECRESFPVLGMDCEWNYVETNSVALLQLATLNGYCALFRFSHLTRVPDVLQNLLMDRSILKVGVGIENDISRLLTNVYSWVDIRHLELLVPMYPPKGPHEEYFDGNRIKLSLEALAKRILGIELDKQHRFSNWRSHKLSPGQIHYAAMDAFASVLIPYELVHHKGAIEAYSVRFPLDILLKYKQMRYQENQVPRNITLWN